MFVINSLPPEEHISLNVRVASSLRGPFVGNLFHLSGGWVRGRPRLGWMDGVKVALGNRGMMVEATCQCAKDRKEWRALVHM